MQPQLMARVYRGNMIESSHYGSAVVVDADGKVVAVAGELGRLTCLRSAAKPLQLLPLFSAGTAQTHRYSLADIAVMCGSHSGQAVHCKQVSGILGGSGLGEAYLQCGIHRPFHNATAKALEKGGRRPGPLHNTCSGKHAAMLALCRHRGWDLSTYTQVGHPVGQEILWAVAQAALVEPEGIPLGVDSCGVPVFTLPLYNIAWAYARLSSPALWEGAWAVGVQTIARAMQRYPLLVAGEGRFTTALLQHYPGPLLAKDGAEGIFCMGLPALGWGIAVKIEDGSDRALPPVILQLLRELDALPPNLPPALEPWRQSELKTHRGETAGRIMAVGLWG